jgi:CheY-like chemotaxis protein
MPKPVAPHHEPRPADEELQTTLRMSRAEAERLREDLERSRSGGEGKTKRAFQRWAFDKVVTMELFQPGGASTVLKYIPRNLSRGGICLLHSAYVHPGSRCVVTLPHPARGSMPVAGQIVRCRHLRGKIHEIGIKFDESCNVRDILCIEVSDGAYELEKVDPTKLSGSLLLIEDSELDRMLVRQFLKDTQMSVTTEGDGQSALKRCKSDSFDVIICDLDIGDVTGLDVLKELRDFGVQTPFILITADNNGKTKSRVKECRPDGFLIKPLSPDRLMGAIGECLLLPGSDGGGGGGNAVMHADLPDGHPVLAHVPTFIEEVKKLATSLNAALKAEDLVTCKRIASQLRGSAPTFGFEPLGQLADKAATAMDASMSVSESAAPIRALIAGCARVRPKKSAA